MKILMSLILCAVFTVPSYAESQEPLPIDGYDVGLDVVLRPFGLVATIVGSATYVAVSPLTALATIPRPHDAFRKLADAMVCNPFKWTFVRPVGNYDYNEGC